MVVPEVLAPQALLIQRGVPLHLVHPELSGRNR